MSAPLNFFHVRKSYRRPGALVPEVVFEDFSLQLAPGELVALVGRSGIGKTTLLHLAAGLDTPDRGAVRIDGQGKPRIGMVFQQPRLLDWLSAADNIRVAIDAAGTDQRRGSECDGKGLGLRLRAFKIGQGAFPVLVAYFACGCVT